MKFNFIIVLVFLFSIQVIQAQKPSVPEIDRIRLAEAFRLGETLGNQIWRD
jgi:hypothetical protein